MERGTAPFSVSRGDYQIHWNAIPAWVCTQCGEPYFEAEEVAHVQQALAAVDRESQKLKATG
jgi:YgiT-type zinc finger domain-containing protein